jgi:TetR/AcrR family transcriptional repressor of nem operon
VIVEATTLDETLNTLLDTSLAEDRDWLILMLHEGLEDGSIRNGLNIEPCADLLLVLLQGLRAMGKLRDPADHRYFVETALKSLG